MTDKKCSKCKVTKNIDLFFKNNRQKDGKSIYCKLCQYSIRKEYLRTKKGLITSIYNHQNSRVKSKGWPYPEYTKKELSNFLLKNRVFKLIYNEWVNSGYKKALIPTVDRIDDYQYYKLSNIQVLTLEQNINKSHVYRKTGLNNKQSSKVAKLTKSNNLLDIYHSINHAARETGLYASHIHNCINPERYHKTAGGFKWMRLIN